MSIQGQNRYPVRTAIDQRGEQTINREAKTMGGIKNVASNSPSVLKWCLNRADQAQNTKALNEMCGIGDPSEIYKPLRPSQILQSEERVYSVIKVLTEEYINPFNINIDKGVFFNISSGEPIPDEISETILQLPSKGKEMYDRFVDERLDKKTVPLHASIKQSIAKSLVENKQTVRIGWDNVKNVEKRSFEVDITMHKWY